MSSPLPSSVSNPLTTFVSPIVSACNFAWGIYTRRQDAVKLGDLKNELNNWTQKVTASKIEHDSLKIDHSALKEKYQALESAHNALKAEVAGLKVENERRFTEFKDFRADLLRQINAAKRDFGAQNTKTLEQQNSRFITRDEIINARFDQFINARIKDAKCR